MLLLSKMLALVASKFEGKFDKQGKPYFLHCLYVMQNCQSDNENILCIALGHDLMEDTDVTQEYLTKEFNLVISKGIEVLTLDQNSDITYEEYIQNILTNGNVSIIKIKLADLQHNSQITRLKGITDKDIKRIEKYHRAYYYLSERIK